MKYFPLAMGSLMLMWVGIILGITEDNFWFTLIGIGVFGTSALIVTYLDYLDAKE